MIKVLLCWLCLAFFFGCAPKEAPPPETPQQKEEPQVKSESYPIQEDPPKTPEKKEEPPPPPPPEPEVLTYSTPIKDYTKNRMNNLRLACKAVNGTVLEPGAEFSFNTIVGPRTAERGYKEAIIFKENEKVKDLGGGICQLSSTLYGAAKAAGLKITDRTTHQLDVDYVKKGEDATVYYGKIDFKFVNTKDKAIRVDTVCKDGKVVVTITTVT